MQLKFSILFILIVASAVVVSCQESPDVNGFKPYGSFDGGSIDSVNLQNGSLIIHIPIPVQYPQRGSTLGLHWLFTANSANWSCVTVSNTCKWQLPSGTSASVAAIGSGVGLDHSLNMAVHRTRQTSSQQGQSDEWVGVYSIRTSDGNSHQMVDTSGNHRSFDAADTSGWHLEVSGADSFGNATTGLAVDRRGNLFQLNGFSGPGKSNGCQPVTGCELVTTFTEFAKPVSITDANGNVFSLNTSNTDMANYKDTMGRPHPGFASISSDSTGCVLNGQTFSSALIFPFPTIGGANAQLKLCYATVSFSTSFSTPSNAQQGSGTATQLATVIMPDGSTWAFIYDSYTNLSSVSLPLGGSISYTWKEVAPNVCMSPSTNPHRAIASRTVTDNNGHSYLWTYHWGADSSTACPFTNTVTDPSLNDTDHVFSAINPGNVFETSTIQFQGTGGTRSPSLKTDTAYTQSTIPGIDPFGISDPVFGNVVPTTFTTTAYPDMKVKSTVNTIDPGPGNGRPIYGLTITQKDYDWGATAPGGALLREIDTVYQWQIADALGNHPYAIANLLNLPASVVTISPTASENTKSSCPINAVGGTAACIAETDYQYDEPAYLQTYTGSLPSGTHGAAPNSVRGNQSSVSRWLNTSGSFVAAHTNWYDTGESYQHIDALGHTKTFSYDPFYAGAYVTETCSPTTGGVAHCISGTYDFNSGLLTSLSNENATTPASGNTQGDSAHTTNYAYDLMLRLTSVQAPPDAANSGARAQTTLSFSAPSTFPFVVQRTKSVTNALSDSATDKYDGLGRLFQNQHLLPNGVSIVDTSFDSNGRPSIVSNPYFSTGDPTYGITTIVYDALDRVTQSTKQDGSVNSVAYSVVTGVHDVSPGANTRGDCTDTLDEAGKQRRACFDALGRTVEVDEVNPTAAASTATGVIVVNGAEQTLGTGTPGSGTVTISGTEHSFCVISPCPPRPLVWDSGSVIITVNGVQKSVSYSHTLNPSASQIAAALRDAFHSDTSAPVDASCTDQPCTTGVIKLTARGTGSTTNYSLSSTSSTNDSIHFDAPSFSAAASGSTLTGGNDPTSDAGTITATVNGTNYSTSFGASDTSISVASRLATAVNASPAVSASSSGNQVNLVSRTAGSTGNATLAVSWTWNTSAFPQASFTAAASGVLGGYDVGVMDNAPYRTLYSYDALGNLVRVDQKGSSPNDSTQWRTRTFVYDSLLRLISATNPESGTITYVYDADGNLLSKTSPAPNQTGSAMQPVSYCYDELHRVTTRDYSAHTYSPPACPITTPIVSYTYDSGTNAKGHLTSMTDQAGTASYSYDILGRLATETRTLPGDSADPSVSKTISYDYNLDGSLKALHYPSGATVTYTPDSAGRVLSAVDSTNNINYVTSATYGPDSALTGFVSGSGGTAAITNSFTYNRRLQPLTMSASTTNQTVFSIGYDFHAGNGTAGSGADNGNVYGVFNNRDHTRDQVFTYDALNRLSSAQNAGTDCSVLVLQGKTKFWGNSYVYDAWGNLLAKSVTNCSAESLTITADTQNRIHATGTPDYQYDAAGNMTFNATPPTLTYTYDQENRLTGAAGYTYTYDGDGNRVRKSNGNLAANGTLYWEMTPGVVAETDLAGTTKSEYIFFEGERVARRDGATGTGGVFYYFSDHLKTASVITDSAGVIKAESDYYPWGGELQFVNNDPNDYKFTGKKNDLETGLYYFGARYYSNSLGRWISADWSSTPVPVPYADFADPQSLSLYSYVRNMPTSKSDQDGHCLEDACVVETGIAVSFLVIATAQYLSLPSSQRSIRNAAEHASSTIRGWFHKTTPPPSTPVNPTPTTAPATTGTSTATGAPAGTTTSTETSVPASTSQQGAVSTAPITSAKSTTAVGVTSSGQAINAYGEKLGPSGKPMRHSKSHSTRKAAKDAARQEGKGAPEEHGGDKHFHPTDENGNKIPNSTHHEYPR